MQRLYMTDIFLDSEKKGRADAANTNALGMNMFFNTFCSKNILTQHSKKVKRMGEDDFNFALLVIVFFVGIFAVSLVYTKIHPENEDFTLKSEPIKVEQPQVIEETVEIVKESPVPSDEDLIAAVVMAEAGNQEMIGKVAVAMVVLNRCDYWGMTVESVVTQENQFAYPYYGEVTEECYEAVRIAQENRSLFPPNMLFFRSTKFHDFGEPYLQIQSHFFSLKED